MQLVLIIPSAAAFRGSPVALDVSDHDAVLRLVFLPPKPARCAVRGMSGASLAFSGRCPWGESNWRGIHEGQDQLLLVAASRRRAQARRTVLVERFGDRRRETPRLELAPCCHPPIQVAPAICGGELVRSIPWARVRALSVLGKRRAHQRRTPTAVSDTVAVDAVL